MNERLKAELELLEKSFQIQHREDGCWIFIKDYMVPSNIGWSVAQMDVCFEVPAAYPATPPDGFYMPAGIQCAGKKPDAYNEPAPKPPPFEGQWGFYSWHHQNGWKATADLRTGSNLVNFVGTIRDRLSQGI
jgi:hypothetical protein